MAKVKPHKRRVGNKVISVRGHHRGKHSRRSHRKAKHHRLMKSRGFRSKMREMMRGMHRRAGSRMHRRRK